MPWVYKLQPLFGMPPSLSLFSLTFLQGVNGRDGKSTSRRPPLEHDVKTSQDTAWVKNGLDKLQPIIITRRQGQASSPSNCFVLDYVNYYEIMNLSTIWCISPEP
ncbi:hypothetical protein FA15DRAFT_662121 [Coprinopsis marcescibilis]|uniref:Uncharacterized protein n=1 Tax=Coprinopsis marcescibilis TaxID=230819 RepID=A0A5C3K9D2_COPMA|nr:hypothetical protein FA15DRAFT_662121 [Coprinopsis marcescibilis]